MSNASVSLMVGTPCYGGQLSWLYTASLLNLQQAALERDWRFGVLVQPADSLVPRARQTICAHFLAEKSATHLLFVDADIGFPVDTVARLIDFDAPVTAAAYPVKQIHWEHMRDAAQSGRGPLESATLTYVVESAPQDAGALRDGFVRARYTGAGFLMIRRDALEQMVERYAELRYTDDRTGAADSLTRVALFNPFIDEATGAYLSEDFAFCQRWRACGGEIWVDLTAKLEHVGLMTYRGDLRARVDF